MNRIDNLTDLSQHLAYEALKYLAKNGPTMSAKEIYDYIESHAYKLDIPEDLKTSYDGHTGPKYLVAMNFKLIGPVKAGWIKKSSPKQGYWTITDDGIAFVKSEKSLEEFIKLSHDKYHEWKRNQKPTTIDDTEDANDTVVAQTVRSKLLGLDPYEFQDLTAGLLEGMGYFIDFNAPRGKDGGVDLVCYRDPLGADAPRIKVQCKHMPETKISRAQISQFAGVINSHEEIGIFVTSGFYTTDAKRYAMERNVHIRLIDGQELEDMWAKYYEKIPEDKQALLPIKFVPVLITDKD